MQRLHLVAAAVALLAVGILAVPLIPSKKFQPPRFPRGRALHGFKAPVDKPEGYQPKATAQYFAAKVDNFNSSNTATYQQRYWYNTQWAKAGGPQFLMIGGESAEDPYWVESDTFEWTTLAKEVGASVYLLEHRFYGASQPTGDLAFSSLKYLTSEQALADVNAFISFINTQQNITNPKWITFGGSYSGALAAWSRQLYPSNVYAAVGSSGPVQAVVDFVGYLEVVYKALKTYNPECASSVAEGLTQVNKLILTAAGRSTLKNDFSLCDTITTDKDTIYLFYESIIGNYMGIVQYSEDNAGSYANYYTIPNLCKQQLSSSSGYNGVVAVNTWLNSMYGCISIDYKEYIDSLKTATTNSDYGDYRAWVWQTCNEFGYYQSTDSALVTNKFTGSVIPVEWYVKQCAEIYDGSLTNATVYGNIVKTNDVYLGQNGYNGTRVVLPNGSNDPWHVLGVLNATNSEVYPVPINGTSHCADMYAPRSADVPSLTAARATIRQYVLSWANSTSS